MVINLVGSRTKGGAGVKNPPDMQVAGEGEVGEMASHSGILAWELTRTEEPGQLQSVGWQRVGHNLVPEQKQGRKVPFF